MTVRKPINMTIYSPLALQLQVDNSTNALESAIELCCRAQMFADPPVRFMRSLVATGSPIGEGEHWQPFAPLPGEIRSAHEIAF